VPEGHTIHRAALDQRPLLAGQQLQVSSPQGRFADGAARLDGQRCTAIEAYGKHLVYRFEAGDSLHVHLGLYGQFRMAGVPVPEPRGAVRVRLLSPSHVVDINGPNTCEVLDGAGLAALTQRIGPDVLRADADPERAFARISKSRTGIGTLIMDQAVMAGVGNIYRSEILWRQKVSPQTPGTAVSRADFDRIWADCVHLLNIGVRENAIITNETAGAARTNYGERVNIFEKSACPACTGAIRKFEIAGRRAFVCDSCQPVLPEPLATR
jgi:endonuclease VIII